MNTLETDFKTPIEPNEKIECFGTYDIELAQEYSNNQLER